MYIPIYFNDKPLFLADALDPELVPYSHHDDAVLIDELNGHTVKTMMHEMQQENVHAGMFIHPHLEELRKAFWKKFRIIEAGGGLVHNEAGNLLFIHRRGYWDLPKGKRDDGESIEECAVREVSEETGLPIPEIVRPLCHTYHTYHQGTDHILKETSWFEMKVPGTPELKPQAEEDINEAIWIDPQETLALLRESYPAIRMVLSAWGPHRQA